VNFEVIGLVFHLYDFPHPEFEKTRMIVDDLDHEFQSHQSYLHQNILLLLYSHDLFVILFALQTHHDHVLDHAAPGG
jgi:hypothetical protein